MTFVPRKLFFTRGVGVSNTRLSSFEEALRAAGIAKFNLVTVSSIFPPGAQIVDRETGLAEMKPGQVVFCVLARLSSCEPNRLISASIGTALPADSNVHGYLSEHHSYGLNQEKCGDYAEDLAASMLASTLGIQFDVDADWDEKEKYFKLSGKIVKTFNTTQTAVVDKNGKWTSVVAAAVLLP
ncbi:MAG: arginine decarboxylase, pyruvoyl-dependent [Candidatus Micrarchaeota archaeon]